MNLERTAYRDLARCLLQHEAGASKEAIGPAAAERICAKLEEGLARLVGPAGFQALWQRALYLARAEFPLLQAVHGPDTCLAGIAERATVLDPAQVNGALVGLLGDFFWLLGTFIGGDLALRQVRRIWPEVPCGEASAGGKEGVQ